MIPTGTDVFKRARRHLNDTEVAAGEVFTDAVLQEHLDEAYAELFTELSSNAARTIRRTMFHNLPAFQSVLYPSEAGVAGMGRPLTLRQRSIKTDVGISGLALGTPSPNQARITTAAAHGLANGQPFVLSGVTGLSPDPNQEWTGSVFDTTNVDALGFALTGTPAFATARLTVSEEQWGLEVEILTDDIDRQPGPSGELSQWAWRDGAFHFQASDTARHIKITYMPSGKAPTAAADSLLIDDSLNFLGARVAGSAALDHGAHNQGAIWMSRADEFKEMRIRKAVLQLQSQNYQQQPFRNKRNTGNIGLLH